MIPRHMAGTAGAVATEQSVRTRRLQGNDILNPFGEIDRRNRALSIAGWITLAAALLAVGPALLETRIVTGLNPWIKPMKFLLSFTIFSWTMAWLVGQLPLSAWVHRTLGRLTALIVLIEVAIITLQAARGTTSHFNQSTWFDTALFFSMGFGIVTLTGIMVLVLALFVVLQVELPRIFCWGIRAGFILFLVGLVPGWMMIYNGSHTVGAADGGPGLLWLNWSTRAGDLRISHFLGLHALQVLPLAGYLISCLTNLTLCRQQHFFLAFTTVYALVMLLTFIQAMMGMPLLDA